MDEAIDRIYECAFVPELWPATLTGLAAATGSEVGLIVRTHPEGFNVLSTPGSEGLIEEYQRLELFSRSQRMPRLFGSPYAGFIQDADIYTDEEQQDDPAYTEFLWVKGLGYGTATAIRLPDIETVIVDFERLRSAGPFSKAQIGWLDAIRPHLARSCMLSFQLDIEKARAHVSSLQLLGRPSAILDGAGRILAANQLFEALMPDTFLDTRLRLRATHRGADQLLEDAIAAKLNIALARSIAIPGQEDRPPMVAHLLPIRRAGRDIFARGSSLIAVTSVGQRDVPAADLVELLFDLSPAEARVARVIGCGATVDQASKTLGISHFTIRTQLKKIFAKTGATRQSELVSLLRSPSL